MNEAIKLAIEKGGYKYGQGIDGDYETDGWSYQEIIDAGIQDKLVLDPLFWQALGKALGWGQWTKTLAEVEHDWELKHYLPDTAKTPVYECRKCSVLKENNVITIENEYEWVEVDKASYTHSYIVKQHGGRYLEGWKFQALKYFDLVLTNGDTEKFWQDLLNPNRE